MAHRILITLFVVWLLGHSAADSLRAQVVQNDSQTALQNAQLADLLQQQNARISQLEQQLGAQQSSRYRAAAYRYKDENGISSEITERFDKLEEELGDLGDEVGDLSGDKTYVHSGTSKSTMVVSGRVHLDLWNFAESEGAIDQFEGSPTDPMNPQNRLGFRRLRFGVKGKVTDNMNYKIEMEFADPNDTTMKDAYFGWTDLPVLQTVLLGNQKRPYGLDHLNSSRYNVFLERPFVIEAFNQDARRIGLCSYSVSDDLRYNWRYGLYQISDTAGSGAYIDDNWQLEFAGRFANTIWYDEVSGGRGYAHWAVSGTFADPDGFGGGDNQARFRTRPEARSSSRWINTGRIDGADTYGLLGVEGVVNVGALQVVGEYQNVWMSREDGFGDDLFFSGGYVYVAYFLTGEHMPWDRKSGTLARIKPLQNFWRVRTCEGCVERGWGAWQIAARYSRGDYTDDDVFGGVGDSFTLGLNWYWNANARMQFNYLNGSIDERFATLEQGDYQIYGARFMIDF